MEWIGFHKIIGKPDRRRFDDDRGHGDRFANDRVAPLTSVNEYIAVATDGETGFARVKPRWFARVTGLRSRLKTDFIKEARKGCCPAVGSP
jgi:hypothetical protein